MVSISRCRAGFELFYGEFDPGSERTLAAGLTHASRARKGLRPRVQRRTGEEHVGNLPFDGGQRSERTANTAYVPRDLGPGEESLARGVGGGACVASASWWGNGLPRRRRVAGLRG